MDVCQTRLEREFDLDIICTAPSVVYQVLPLTPTPTTPTPQHEARNPKSETRNPKPEIYEPGLKFLHPTLHPQPSTPC